MYITAARSYVIESDKPKMNSKDIAAKLFPTTDDDSQVQNGKGSPKSNTNSDPNHETENHPAECEKTPNKESNIVGETVEPEEILNKSSIVWLCTRQGYVAVLDLIDKHGECIDSFRVCASPLLCIAAVPGFISRANYAAKSHINQYDEHDDEFTTAAEQQDAAAMERYNTLMGKKATYDVHQPCMWIGSESGW